MTLPDFLDALGCALGAVALVGLAMWFAEWLLALVVWKLR